MFVNPKILLVANPFFDAYINSDFLGKLIFIGLILLSIVSWVILIHKVWVTYRARKHSAHFYAIFQSQRNNPLNLEYENAAKLNKPNPFYDLYSVLKKHTLDLLNKNRKFGQNQHLTSNENHSYLSQADIDFVDTHLMSTVAAQTQHLERNLFILAMVVGLGPFLGLLGTVWGILTSFSEMQNQTGGSTNEMVIGGLSLALATTVLGLLDAIPALVGYSYIKNSINSFETDMEGFSTEILSAVEMQYRKVD